MPGLPIRKSRVICMPFPEKEYGEIVIDTKKFREVIEVVSKAMPEIFPTEIVGGYLMKDIYHSIKLDINIRRISINNISYTVRPSFVMPYLTGKTANVGNALFLRHFNVPYWGLVHIFGKNPMYWYRLEQHLGHFSIIGTTIKNTNLLPSHISADEKHTKLRGEKVYLATTVAKECILGVAVSDSASEASLTKAYGHFKEEASILNPNYAPETVNTDGWEPTIRAWKNNFVKIVCIRCILHAFIKLRDGAKSKYKEAFSIISKKFWHAYNAKTKATFSQRIRRLKENCKKMVEIPMGMINSLEKLKERIPQYSVFYDHDGAHRTSNMGDRHMGFMDRHLFSTRYFHGDHNSAQFGIRGWALIQNFAPSCPYTMKKYNGQKSPAERLNEFRYSDNWLENLLISGSLQARYGPPQNPL